MLFGNNEARKAARERGAPSGSEECVKSSQNDTEWIVVVNFLINSNEKNEKN